MANAQNPTILSFIDHVGGLVPAAAALGLKSHGTIIAYRDGVARIPPKRALIVATILGCALSDLRPDIWAPEVRPTHQGGTP